MYVTFPIRKLTKTNGGRYRKRVNSNFVCAMAALKRSLPELPSLPIPPIPPMQFSVPTFLTSIDRALDTVETTRLYLLALKQKLLETNTSFIDPSVLTTPFQISPLENNDISEYQNEDEDTDTNETQIDEDETEEASEDQANFPKTLIDDNGNEYFQPWQDVPKE
jgi:hypothetical protein